MKTSFYKSVHELAAFAYRGESITYNAEQTLRLGDVAKEKFP